MKIVYDLGFYLGLLGLAVWAIYMLWGPRGYMELVDVRSRAAGITTETESIQRDNRMLEEMVRRLKHDGRYIEHIARYEMGLAGENDLIFTFDGPVDDGAGPSGNHD